jgi:hypothetical protein
MHAGASVTLLLFGEAHQAHFREAEGAVVALFDARLDTAHAGAASLKASEARGILKLGTSADYALCGAKKKARGRAAPDQAPCAASLSSTGCACTPTGWPPEWYSSLHETRRTSGQLWYCTSDDDRWLSKERV